MSSRAVLRTFRAAHRPLTPQQAGQGYEGGWRLTQDRETAGA